MYNLKGIGESAGANLCIAVALKMKDKVSSVIVHSPFVDFTGSLERSEHEIDDFPPTFITCDYLPIYRSNSFKL